MRRTLSTAIICVSMIAVLVAVAPLSADIEEVPLKNASFEEGANDVGTPTGWELYSSPQRSEQCHVKLVDDASDGENALLIHDGDMNEIGVTQVVPVKGGVTYKVTLMVKPLPGQSTAGSQIQMRWLPTNTWAQEGIVGTNPDQFTETSCLGTAPDDATSLRIYLYTHKDPAPRLIIDNVKLLSGIPPPPPPSTPWLPKHSAPPPPTWPT